MFVLSAPVSTVMDTLTGAAWAVGASGSSADSSMAAPATEAIPFVFLNDINSLGG